jgi:hypothetical protein
MFYVIYNTETKQYLDAENKPCAFADAERYQPREREICTLGPNERWVGPCIEGETP